MCLCSKQSSSFSFYALSSGGKSKGAKHNLEEIPKIKKNRKNVCFDACSWTNLQSNIFSKLNYAKCTTNVVLKDGFVCAYIPAVPGSNPKHTIYTLLWIFVLVLTKGRKWTIMSEFGPHFKSRKSRLPPTKLYNFDYWRFKRDRFVIGKLIWIFTTLIIIDQK